MEIVEDANKKLLEDPERYLKYLLQVTDDIINDFNVQYNDIKDNRKEYPRFTVKQFSFILQMINKRVFKAHVYLLHDNNNISRYNIPKVELAFSIFELYCTFYSMTYNIYMFTLFCGIDKCTMLEWLSSGKSKLYLAIKENGENLDGLDMINSKNALLRLHYRNHAENERIIQGSSDTLPDLLPPVSPVKSITDGQQGN